MTTITMLAGPREEFCLEGLSAEQLPSDAAVDADGGDCAPADPFAARPLPAGAGASAADAEVVAGEEDEETRLLARHWLRM